MVDCSACPLPIKHIIANENRCLYIAVCKGFFDSENMGFSWKFMFDDIGLPERSGKIDVRMGEGQLPGENEQQIFWDNLSEDSLPHWFSCYVPISSYFHIFPQSTEKLWDFVFYKIPMFSVYLLSMRIFHLRTPRLVANGSSSGDLSLCTVARTFTTGGDQTSRWKTGDVGKQGNIFFRVQWGIPRFNSWLVHNGNSYLNWWFTGSSIAGNPHGEWSQSYVIWSLTRPWLMGGVWDERGQGIIGRFYDIFQFRLIYKQNSINHVFNFPYICSSLCLILTGNDWETQRLQRTSPEIPNQSGKDMMGHTDVQHLKLPTFTRPKWWPKWLSDWLFAFATGETMK